MDKLVAGCSVNWWWLGPSCWCSIVKVVWWNLVWWAGMVCFGWMKFRILYETLLVTKKVANRRTGCIIGIETLWKGIASNSLSNALAMTPTHTKIGITSPSKRHLGAFSPYSRRPFEAAVAHAQHYEQPCRDECFSYTKRKHNSYHQPILTSCLPGPLYNFDSIQEIVQNPSWTTASSSSPQPFLEVSEEPRLGWRPTKNSEAWHRWPTSWRRRRPSAWLSHLLIPTLSEQLCS